MCSHRILIGKVALILHYLGVICNLFFRFTLALLLYCIEHGAYTGLPFKPDDESATPAAQALTKLEQMFSLINLNDAISTTALQEDPSWSNKI